MTQSTKSCKSCDETIRELLQVNQCWKSDYGDLMAQNQQLKATLAYIKQKQETTLATQTATPTTAAQTATIPCTVDEIESLKDQIRLYQEKYLNEQKEKNRQRQHVKEWQQKYEDLQSVNRELNDQVETLKFKMEILGHKDNQLAEENFKVRIEQRLQDQRNKVRLMQEDIFPNKRHCDESNHSKDIDERDHAPTYQKGKSKRRNTTN